MLTQVFIKNYKAFERKTIMLNKHNMIIGENDAGKSSLLSALDIFFNYEDNEKIDKNYIRDTSKPVEIAIWYNDKFYKKIYSPSTFKLSDSQGDFEDLVGLKYIYIPVMNYDPKQLIIQLATAKAIVKTENQLIEQLREISQKSIDEVINSIDTELLVIDRGETKIVGQELFKYESALKFGITSDNIPIESRGSGFQKNLMYSLLIGSEYDNVILAVDEIENSLSINNCNGLIKNIQNNINQTLISTHSKEMLKIRGDAGIVPIYNGKYNTLSDLLASLDSYDDKCFLLVEDKFDLPWFRKAICLLDKSSDFIVLPSGGCDDSEHLKKALIEEGKKCIVIKDGDASGENILKLECVELYVPLDYCNKLFDLNLSSIPTNKKDFFEATKSPERVEDSVKKILSNHVEEFLTVDNSLVSEIESIISKI